MTLSLLSASWIWRRQESYTPYHQTILARKNFRLARPTYGSLKIAVDGGYRLWVNNQWVADGPARSWPEHLTYDELDVAPYLQAGTNELVVIARHWQVGDFHTRPQQAGLWVQLDLFLDSGAKRRIISDESWQVAWLPAWVGNTPKVSIQMEPQELYDARLEGEFDFAPAAVLYPALGGPWQGLHPRDVALLDRRPRSPVCFLSASRVRQRNDLHFCLPAVRLAENSATTVEANFHASAAGGMAAVLALDSPAEITLAPEGMVASIDGKTSPDGRYTLAAGRHLLAAFTWPMFGHRKERSLRIIEAAGLSLVNPMEPAWANPWVYLAMPEFALREDDLDWIWFDAVNTRRDGLMRAYHQAVVALLREPTFASLCNHPSCEVRLLSSEEMFVTDTHWHFLTREVIGDANRQVDQPAALMHDNAALTTVHISPAEDIELAYDLGEQTVGYFDFELIAPAGLIVDTYAVEYIAADGTIQHTGDYHNGLRYITRAGLNRFTSLKRRAGRYLFLTFRAPPGTVEEFVTQVRLVRVIESTYPADRKGFFECSDAALGKVWQISARTLELCMEDTFTDCPLYEQTCWVGDARNEAIYAFNTFGATDIARRCLRLAAESLDRYPLVGGQVPSSWDMILPAWSFLWGIAVWDYYFYTGDRAVLAELWPAVMRNLEGAAGRLDANGLFSGKFWNMFDWAGIDDHHETVLHNSLLLVGAVVAAEKMAAVLGEMRRELRLKELREYLEAAINRWWNPQKSAYPDSIHEDGQPSDSTCQHTSFLALLYGVLPAEHQAVVLEHILNPPEEMVRVGSPFAIHYLYEALAKMGLPGAILDSINENYLPMLAAGATTVWEVFPTSGDRPSGFPTRSHCHAWSAAPLHFLPQVVLGIEQTEVGGAAYKISPWIGKLDWAKGAVCTARGMLEVSWQRKGNRLELNIRAPAGVRVQFEQNGSMEGLEPVITT